MNIRSITKQALIVTAERPRSAVAAWDANAPYRAAELSGDIDTAYQSLIGHIEHNLSEARLAPRVRVLDAGCGVGATTSSLDKLGYEVVGIDPSTESIQQANVDYPQCRFHAMALQEMAKRTTEPLFDAVVANMVLHTVADLDSFLLSAARMLVEDGVFIATLPHPWYYLLQRTDVEFTEADYKEARQYWLKFRIHGQPSHPSRVPYIHRPEHMYLQSLKTNFFGVEAVEAPPQVGVGKPRDILIIRARLNSPADGL